MFESKVFSTHDYMPADTIFIVKTYYHYVLGIFITDYYMYDGAWNEGYDPMDHENFECRLFHNGITSSSDLQSLHNTACNEVTSGKFCSGRYLFP